MEYAQLRDELDAYYACLYGLTRDELRYTPLASTQKKFMCSSLHNKTGAR